MTWCRSDSASNLILTLHIQTGAKRTEAAGLHGDALKIKLAASPIEGKANTVLLKFLAKIFDVPIYQVSLKQGIRSRHKVVEIRQSSFGLDALFKPPLNLTINNKI